MYTSSTLMREPEELYKEYVNCYSLSKDLSKFKSSAETFQVFKLKQGLPVKIVNTKKSMKFLPMDNQLIGADSFYQKNKSFYLVPNDYKGKILSFIVRGMNHDYHDVFPLCNIKPMFGWGMFEDYTFNTPIILTEGAKDCIVLQQYYPYVLATLTAGITVTNLKILKQMTNKVVLAYDNDSTGSKEVPRAVESLQNLKFQVQTLRPRKKDFGQEYNCSEYLVKSIPETMRKFSKLGDIL